MQVSLLPLLALLFIAFKLLGIITWSWWWVLAPVWGTIALGAVMWAIVGLLAIFLVVGSR